MSSSFQGNPCIWYRLSCRINGEEKFLHLEKKTKDIPQKSRVVTINKAGLLWTNMKMEKISNKITV